eukprot:m.69938 g.69938  ORF g.69938 m.69938 type:complete len:665 (+) comp12243_c0_seq1:688-2682(+)
MDHTDATSRGPSATASPWLREDLSGAWASCAFDGCEPGHFVVSRTTQYNDNACDDVLYLTVKVAGMAAHQRFAGYHHSDGSVHPCVVDSFDQPNDEFTVSFVDRRAVNRRRVARTNLLGVSPRLESHLKHIPIVCNGGRWTLQLSHITSEFDTLQDLIAYLQTGDHLHFRNFLDDYRYFTMTLSKSPSPAWTFQCSPAAVDAARLTSSLVLADEQLAVTMPRAEANEILLGHWVQPGDYIIRHADNDCEVENDCRYVITFMVAIHVDHIPVLVDENGFLYIHMAKDFRFYLLSELMDHLIAHERYDGIPFRRVVCVGDSQPLYAEDTGKRRIPKFSRPVVASHVGLQSALKRTTQSESCMKRQPHFAPALPTDGDPSDCDWSVLSSAKALVTRAQQLQHGFASHSLQGSRPLFSASHPPKHVPNAKPKPLVSSATTRHAPNAAVDSVPRQKTQLRRTKSQSGVTAARRAPGAMGMGFGRTAFTHVRAARATPPLRASATAPVSPISPISPTSPTRARPRPGIFPTQPPKVPSAGSVGKTDDLYKFRTFPESSPHTLLAMKTALRRNYRSYSEAPPTTKPLAPPAQQRSLEPNPPPSMQRAPTLSALEDDALGSKGMAVSESMQGSDTESHHSDVGEASSPSNALFLLHVSQAGNGQSEIDDIFD